MDKVLLEIAKTHAAAVKIIANAIKDMGHPSLKPQDIEGNAVAILSRLAHAGIVFSGPAEDRCLADELNAALNLIGEHCGKHLAPGWVLSIHHDNGEQWIQLEDSEGNDIDAWMHDSTHAIVDACDFSLTVHHG